MTHAVQVRSADQAEFLKRIGIEALGQCLLRELPELDPRFERNLGYGLYDRLRRGNNPRWSKEPHAVNKPDQALFIARQLDVVMCVGVQKQIRRVEHEVGVNRLPFAT